MKHLYMCGSSASKLSCNLSHLQKQPQILNQNEAAAILHEWSGSRYYVFKRTSISSPSEEDPTFASGGCWSIKSKGLDNVNLSPRWSRIGRAQVAWLQVPKSHTREAATWSIEAQFFDVWAGEALRLGWAIRPYKEKQLSQEMVARRRDTGTD